MKIINSAPFFKKAWKIISEKNFCGWSEDLYWVFEWQNGSEVRYVHLSEEKLVMSICKSPHVFGKFKTPQTIDREIDCTIRDGRGSEALKKLKKFVRGEL